MNRKRFVRWDADPDALSIGPHIQIPGYLVWATAISLFALFMLGALTSTISGTGMLPLILVTPFIILVILVGLYTLWGFITWFIMEWVYVFQPWKRPKKEEKPYYTYY